MKQRVLGIGVCLVFALCGASRAAMYNELALANAQGKANVPIAVDLTLVSDQQVQGFVAAAEWDGSTLPAGVLKATTVALTPAAEIADVKVSRVGLDTATKVGYFVLGVVMDSDGQDGEILPVSPAPGLKLATVTMLWELAPGDVIPDTFADQTIPLTFVDSKYGTADSGTMVTLDNIVVVGGLSIGKVEGLVLTNGSVKLLAPPPATLTIVSKTGAKFGSPADVKVQLESKNAVQGFTIAIKSTDAALSVQGIAPTGASLPTDFFDAEVFPTDGATLGVIIDFAEPWNSPAPIPAGTHEIATLTVSSSVTIGTQADCDKTATYPLEFVDFVYGDPLKENVIVIAGQSKTPDKAGGTVSFEADKTKDPCAPPPQGLLFAYAVGGCTLVDDPTNTDKDVHMPAPITVTAGTDNVPGKFQVGLWYRNPPNPYATDEGQNQLEHIQGLSMAVQFDTTCIWCDGTYSLAGTITEAVGAEFVNVLCENRTDDIGSDDTAGVDDGELIVGILVDAVAPFDGKDLPPTNDYLKVVCVDFHVTAPSGVCQQCKDPVVLHLPKYPDGADVIGPNGVESPVIRNVATIRTRIETAPGVWTTIQESVIPKQYVDGTVTILNEPVFVRGDCNWSQYVRDDAHTQFAVDISDAAAVISFLFYDDTWQFLAPCLDACDANDDGRIDLADAVYILRYLYKFGNQPPAPFPEPGIDASKDRLDCQAGSVCQ